MGEYDTNLPPKAEFQGFGSQEELDAAIQLGGLKEDSLSGSLETESQEGAKKISLLAERSGIGGSEGVANTLLDKKERAGTEKVLTKILDSKSNKLSIAQWEEKKELGRKKLSKNMQEATENIDELNSTDKNLIIELIHELEDKIEEKGREFTNEKNFGKTIIVEGKEVDLYDNLEEEINDLTQKLDTVRKKYTDLFGKGLGLTEDEKAKVRGMDVGDFLRNYSRDERLKFVTFQGEAGNIGKVDSLTFTFSYDGVFNRELYTKLTAGQVLGEAVNSVKFGGVEYTRSSLLGEFFNADGKRLKIKEGTSVTDIQYRNENQIQQLESKVLSSIPDKLKNNFIAQEAVKRGIDPEIFIDIAGKAISGIKNKEYQRAALEEELTSFERFKGFYGVGGEVITKSSIKESIAQQKVIAALFNQVNGKEQGWYGEREFAKKSGYESVYNEGLKSLSENYGINTERLGETTLGKRIVDHLKKRNFRPYEGQAYNCGKNVGEALRAIGIVGQGIPRGGRDGRKWRGFMRQRPDFVESSVDAKNAPAGSVISYQPVKNKGSGPRQENGHVEIALGNGKFWFGATLSQPGGSYENPPRNTYTVFVPKGSVVGGEKKEEKVDDKKVQEKEKKAKEVQAMSEKFKNLDSTSLEDSSFHEDHPEFKNKVIKNFDTIKRGATTGFDRLAKKGLLSSQTPVTVFSLNKDRDLSVAFHYSPSDGKIKAYPVGYGVGIGGIKSSHKTPLGSFKVENVKIDKHDVDVSNGGGGTIMGNRSTIQGLDGDVNNNSYSGGDMRGRFIYLHGTVKERGENISRGEHGDGTYNKDAQTSVSKGCWVMQTKFSEIINRENQTYSKHGAYFESVYTSGTTIYTGSNANLQL